MIVNKSADDYSLKSSSDGECELKSETRTEFGRDQVTSPSSNVSKFMIRDILSEPKRPGLPIIHPGLHLPTYRGSPSPSNSVESSECSRDFPKDLSIRSAVQESDISDNESHRKFTLQREPFLPSPNLYARGKLLIINTVKIK